MFSLKIKEKLKSHNVKVWTRPDQVDPIVKDSNAPKWFGHDCLKFFLSIFLITHQLVYIFIKDRVKVLKLLITSKNVSLHHTGFLPRVCLISGFILFWQVRSILKQYKVSKQQDQDFLIIVLQLFTLPIMIIFLQLFTLPVMIQVS